GKRVPREPVERFVPGPLGRRKRVRRRRCGLSDLPWRDRGEQVDQPAARWRSSVALREHGFCYTPDFSALKRHNLCCFGASAPSRCASTISCNGWLLRLSSVSC